MWEETFHTVTEALAKVDARLTVSRRRRDAAPPLHCLMNEDRRSGAYDTREQNRREGGDYDDNTALVELLHQV